MNISINEKKREAVMRMGMTGIPSGYIQAFAERGAIPILTQNDEIRLLSDKKTLRALHQREKQENILAYLGVKIPTGYGSRYYFEYVTDDKADWVEYWNADEYVQTHTQETETMVDDFLNKARYIASPLDMEKLM